jgi:hypothetical protein
MRGSGLIVGVLALVTAVPVSVGADQAILREEFRQRIEAAYRTSDRLLQVTMVGLDHPPITLEDHRKVMQSSDRLRRVPLRDNGYGNRSLMFCGQCLQACVVTNTAERG